MKIEEILGGVSAALALTIYVGLFVAYIVEMFRPSQPVQEEEL